MHRVSLLIGVRVTFEQYVSRESVRAATFIARRAMNFFFVAQAWSSRSHRYVRQRTKREDGRAR
jgi:hypothetical protein